MPYEKPKKVKGGIRFNKPGGGGFTAHTTSMSQAKKTAGIREWFASGAAERRGAKRPSKKK